MVQERHLLDKVWDLTKDLSVKVSRKVEKHWKINTLRVEIASLKQRRSTKFKELGQFVYTSLSSGLSQEEEYKNTIQSFFHELKEVDEEIAERKERIELLEEQFRQMDETAADDEDLDDEDAMAEVDLPPVPDASVVESEGDAEPETKPAPEPKKAAAPAKKPAAKSKPTRRKKTKPEPEAEET
ncbi:MAG: hypothetical protein H6510_04565 [Acidobacteria bacterium]|nr:hypothetical protein [Acidobacteriota bacterium]MCB9397069.1 hypothetical protein [Acidobacteriota bacterium]